MMQKGAATLRVRYQPEPPSDAPMLYPPPHYARSGSHAIAVAVPVPVPVSVPPMLMLLVVVVRLVLV
jgi:hypothetical protein